MGILPAMKSKPRRRPGQLFYPTEASHVFEKYWDYLSNLNDHPDFASERHDLGIPVLW
jgi:hypothetical protein